MFAERGLEIPYPADLLFIHRWVYDWGLLLERAIAAAALGASTRRADDLDRRLLAARATRAAATIEELRPREPRLDAPSQRSGRRHAARRQTRRARPSGAARRRSVAERCGSARSSSTSKPAWPAFNPSIARATATASG